MKKVFDLFKKKRAVRVAVQVPQPEIEGEAILAELDKIGKEITAYYRTKYA